MFERLGRTLGNWNDAHSKHDLAAEVTLRYKVLNEVAGWLYTWSEHA